MRTVSLFIATSLDGRITGPGESLDWLFTDRDYGYKKFFKSIDTVIMGRKTFAIACTFENIPYAGKAKYVFTHQQITTDVPGVKFILNDPSVFVRALKAKPGKKIWIVGGAEIVKVLLNADLIDEIIMSVHPIILSEGIPLFSGIRNKSGWSLQKSKKFSSGLVQLTYMRKR